MKDVKDVIRVRDRYYILATSSRLDDRTRVLKDEEAFLVVDRYGDILPQGMGEQGLYYQGTRFLSHLEFLLCDRRPLLLSSVIRADNALLAVSMTNPDMHQDGQVVLPRNTLHVFRSLLLRQGTCYLTLRLRNYGSHPVDLAFSVEAAADFADIFEVRGMKRPRRGAAETPESTATGVILGYEGLDGVVRRTRIEASPSPATVSGSRLEFRTRVDSREVQSYSVSISCEVGKSAGRPPSYEAALREAVTHLKAKKAHTADLYGTNEQFNDWLSRSLSDLTMMLSQTPEGPYPYAGVPWFSTVFGRDGLITALETLWANPSIARGVLAHLAALQAQEFLPEQDAEPGKILHESRQGEMAALGEIPFGRYYGSVDATPLFVMLAGAYYERTGDQAFVQTIWPHVERALEWMKTYGDRDGDGFVEYFKRSAKGLVHQGWKDSEDAVFHADGSPADGPIALCEVQGYVYAAKRRAAELASLLGKADQSAALSREAERLQQSFAAAFWDEAMQTYALALDGEKRPCRIRASNAGHCLYTGLAQPEHARRMAVHLLEDEFFSGWGIRTLATSEARYNPMSYHNGSVWPHDNALIAAGLSRYGLREPVLRIMTGLLDVSLFADLRRLPELLCGFRRRNGEGPTFYPVACAPQSWASGAVLLLLQAALGLVLDAPGKQIRLVHPALPEWLPNLRIQNLRLGEASVDLNLSRHPLDVEVGLLRREGDVEIVVIH